MHANEATTQTLLCDASCARGPAAVLSRPAPHVLLSVDVVVVVGRYVAVNSKGQRHRAAAPAPTSLPNPCAPPLLLASAPCFSAPLPHRLVNHDNDDVGCDDDPETPDTRPSATTEQTIDDFKTQFATTEYEYEYWVEPAWVEGTLPKELRGTYLRNGPGLQVRSGTTTRRAHRASRGRSCVKGTFGRSSWASGRVGGRAGGRVNRCDNDRCSPTRAPTRFEHRIRLTPTCRAP